MEQQRKPFSTNIEGGGRLGLLLLVVEFVDGIGGGG